MFISVVANYSIFIRSHNFKLFVPHACSKVHTFCLCEMKMWTRLHEYVVVAQSVKCFNKR